MTHCSVLFTELKLFWPRIVLKINRTVRYMILRMCRPIFSLGLPSTLPSVQFSKAHHCVETRHSHVGLIRGDYENPSVSLSTKHTIQPQGFVPAELHVIGVTGHTCNQGPPWYNLWITPSLFQDPLCTPFVRAQGIPGDLYGIPLTLCGAIPVPLCSPGQLLK